MPNRQLTNVGNSGDVLKHAALVALADWMQSEVADTQVNYLETHAFRLDAPWGVDEATWEQEMKTRVAARPSYGAYAAHESPRKSGTYRCSVGLAIDVLQGPRLFLSEKDTDTRAVLIEQLRLENVEPHFVLTEAEDFSNVAAAPRGPLLGLVDPFSSVAEIWAHACHAVGVLHEASMPGVVLVFKFGEKGTWPPALLPPLWNLVARVDEGPFHLVCLATRGHGDAVRGVLLRLGWTALP